MSAHIDALRLALSRLAGKPFTSLLSALVIAIALTLPATGYVLVSNVAELARGMTGKPEISVFLKNEIQGDATRAVEQRLQKHPGVTSVRFVPRDAALKGLAERGGLTDVTAALADNPLPDAFIIEPSEATPAMFAALKTEFTNMPEVALVQLDAEWVERLAAILRLARSSTLILGVLLGTALIIVTFNTIRLQILTQRHEISVKLLLGATRGYVRRPYLYFGFLQGLAGGLLALGLVSLLVRLVAPQIEALAQRYSVTLAIHGAAASETAALLIFAAVLGWLGAWLSVHRHIHDGLPD